MKKILIASGVAVFAFAFALTTQAAFTRNLMVGSTGTDVSELQSWLISKGHAIPSISSGAVQPGYFGAQTKAAVMAYQAANGIPNTGFFGPLTRASVGAGGTVAGGTVPCPAGFDCKPTGTTPVCPVGYECKPKDGGPTITTTLAGTDGSISDVQTLSQYNNEDVGDGENDVKVAGFEIETSTDGDVLLRSMKIAFDPAGNASGNSDKLNDYVDSVTIWMGDKKIGSADAADFDKSSSDIYTKTITLTGSPIVKADKTEKFYITVDAISNLDSSDIDSDPDWSIDVQNIRFEDGSGVVTTEDSAGDLTGDMNIGIDFVDFATSADTELKFSKDSSSPEDGIVVVDDVNDTNDVTLLVGKIKLDGTSDVVLDELPITLTTNGDSVGALTGTLTLKIDGQEYSESVGLTAAQTGSVTFDNLNIDLQAGETVTFTIKADVNDTNNTGVTATDFDEGDYLVASFSASNRALIDAENSEGDQLTDSEKSGTATGEGQEFRTEGIGLTLVSTNTDATTGTSNNDDIGLLTIKYKVTAIGNTVYVSSTATSTDAGTYSTVYAVDKDGTATTSTRIAATIVNNDDTTLSTYGNYQIDEGESETFTLSVSVPLGTGGTSGQYRAALSKVKWDTTDSVTMSNSYTSALDEFKTAYKVLN